MYCENDIVEGKLHQNHIQYIICDDSSNQLKQWLALHRSNNSTIFATLCVHFHIIQTHCSFLEWHFTYTTLTTNKQQQCGARIPAKYVPHIAAQYLIK